MCLGPSQYDPRSTDRTIFLYLSQVTHPHRQTWFCASLARAVPLDSLSGQVYCLQALAQRRWTTTPMYVRPGSYDRSSSWKVELAWRRHELQAKQMRASIRSIDRKGIKRWERNIKLIRRTVSLSVCPSVSLSSVWRNICAFVPFLLAEASSNSPACRWSSTGVEAGF
jgi:hypothetical protein